MNLFEENLPKVETKFFIDELKRTVVCVVTTYDEVARRLAKYNLADDKYENSLFSDVRKYVGVAKCSDEDEWNENYGCKLAEYRATKQRKADINEELIKYIKGMKINLDKLESYGLIKNPHYPSL